MILDKIRYDIDPRDFKKVNEMAKALVNSGKWKNVGSSFLQHDLLSGKTFAEKNPEMISSLYKDLQRKAKKKSRTTDLKSINDIFGPPSLSKKS